jgi:hypothetical protein
MWHVWGRRKMFRGVWWENQYEGGRLKDLSVDGMIMLKWNIKKWDGRNGLD